MDIESFSILLFYVTSFSILALTLLYGFAAPWWRSTTGKAFMTILGSFSFLVLGTFAAILIPDNVAWIPWVRIVVYSAMLTGLWWVGGIIVHAQFISPKPGPPKKTVEESIDDRKSC